MNNKDFWNEISSIIDEGFTDKGLTKLEHYAELFINQRLVYKRFSSFEQHGCTTGGGAHVIATLLAGANFAADSGISKPLTVKEERQRAKEQETVIENWAKKVNCWYDDADIKFAELFGGQIAEGGEAHVFLHGLKFLKTIGLDYYLQPVLALDRISLHNAFFPETRLDVMGFGRLQNGEFQIIAEQNHIQGSQMSDDEIAGFAQKMGFKLINPKNWTFATPEIYLSDLHDENVIRSKGGNIFVIDCDIRINTPDLRCGGIRKLTTEVEFM
jgi:hypothetical protein